MRIYHLFKTASNGLLANRSRSGLTILGIVIGITAIILVMSLGEGAQNLILGQVKSMGSKTIAVLPGKMSGGLSGMAATMADSLKVKDYEDLKNRSNVPYADKIMPIVFGSETIIYGTESYKPIIFGASSFFPKIFDIYPEEGRVFTEEEVSGYADVVVIGSKIKDELFGNSDVLNEKIKIKGRNFRIIGILGKKGQSSFVNFDDAAIIPFSTAQQYIFGIKYFNRIIIEAASEANVDKTAEDITTILRNNHDITDPKKDDFTVQTQAQAMDTVKTLTTVLTLFLAAVAAISLLVGGVGIMNIMLVSVTERTREIGLRKALGATDRDILTHFLLEATILTSIGGLIGIILGLSLSFLISIILINYFGLAWTFSFPVLAILLGFGVSTFIGLVFGIYPAREAAKKSPIEALRFE
jgi:putative ABC transport system permease protein